MIPSDEANRILTGLIFLGVKAEHLRASYQSLQGNVEATELERLRSALTRMQNVCAEGLLHEPTRIKRDSAHSTLDALLAVALIDLFAAANANNMELSSAILRELNRKHSIVSANAADSKTL